MKKSRSKKHDPMFDDIRDDHPIVVAPSKHVGAVKMNYSFFDASARDARPSPDRRPEVLLCCLPGFDNFVDDLIRTLAQDVLIRKVVSGRLEDYVAELDRCNTVWLEWGNQLAESITRQMGNALRHKRVICRIHSYEVLDGLADRLDFSLVDDLIFVAPHIRDILLARRPDIAQHVKRLHVIPNGVDLQRFPLIQRDAGFNVAFLGAINFKKDPMVLLHAFQAIHAADPRFRLHIGGKIDNLRYQVAIRHFVRKNDLEDAVVGYGRVADVQGWLANMHYIMCSSLMEGHPVGLLEAMATGCQPLIYNWPGAESFYPSEFIWKSIDELRTLIGRRMEPRAAREFVEANYSLERQVRTLKRVLCDGETVVFNGLEPKTADASVADASPNEPDRGAPAPASNEDQPSEAAGASAAQQPGADRKSEGEINFVHKLPLPVGVTNNRKRYTIDYCRGKNVLHVGCVDSGIMEKRIAEKNHLHYHLSTVARRLIGIDINEDGISRLRESGFEAHVVDVQTDLDKLRELTRDMDVMVIPEVIEHLPNVGQFLANLNRCDFSGDILISTPNSFSYRGFHMLTQHNAEMVHPDHNCYFSPTTLGALLKKYGFRIEKLVMYFWPSNDEFGRAFEQALMKCPYIAEGIIAVVKREASVR